MVKHKSSISLKIKVKPLPNGSQTLSLHFLSHEENVLWSGYSAVEKQAAKTYEKISQRILESLNTAFCSQENLQYKVQKYGPVNSLKLES